MLNIVDVKKKGIKAIDEEIDKHGVATLSYRKRPKYIILKIEEYKELELELTYKKALEEIASKKMTSIKTEEELDKYLAELKEEIKE